MKLNHLFQFLLPIVFLGHLALSAQLTSFCITNYGATPVTPLPTGSYSATDTLTRTITSTSTPVTTFTPLSSTATKTVTTTIKSTVTLAKTTNTYTSTSTIYSTSTVTSATATTLTNTAEILVTNTDPATATPSPDFTPLALELSPGGYTVAACSPTAKVKRGDRNFFERGPDAAAMLLPRQTASSSSNYPTSVSCTSLFYATATSTNVVAASTTSTKSLKPGTVTQTSTVSLTTTSTKVPSGVSLTVVSSTATVTAVVTATSTTITTTTSTSTTYMPASTVYPACLANNQVQCVDGYQVSNPSFTYNIFAISGPTDPGNCCIACSLLDNCGGSFFDLDTEGCYGVIADTCEGGGSFASFQVQPGNFAPYVYSNSNCGRWRVVPPSS